MMDKKAKERERKMEEQDDNHEILVSEPRPALDRFMKKK